MVALAQDADMTCHGCHVVMLSCLCTNCFESEFRNQSLKIVCFSYILEMVPGYPYDNVIPI